MAQAYRKVTSHDHKSADAQGHVLEHILVAERALGRPLPDGVEVHHIDNDGTNNANANLVICQDKAYHKRLHVRARIVAAGGDPNTEKFCSDCGRCRAFPEFNIRTGHKSTGRQSVCRECQKVRWRKRCEVAA